MARPDLKNLKLISMLFYGFWGLYIAVIAIEAYALAKGWFNYWILPYLILTMIYWCLSIQTMWGFQRNAPLSHWFTRYCLLFAVVDTLLEVIMVIVRGAKHDCEDRHSHSYCTR